MFSLRRTIASLLRASFERLQGYGIKQPSGKRTSVEKSGRVRSVPPLRKSSSFIATPAPPARFEFYRCTISVDRDDLGVLQPIVSGPDNDETRQIVQFIDFLSKKSSAATLIDNNRIEAMKNAFRSWQEMLGPRDKRGRLKKSMMCIGFSRSLGRCLNMTMNPNGLCHHHASEGSLTIWNSEWGTEFEIEAERRKADQKASEESWDRSRRIALEIKHTATERQVIYLLELGAKPSELNGITKAQASELIDKLLYG